MKKIVSLIPLLFFISFLSFARNTKDSAVNDIIQKYIDYGAKKFAETYTSNALNDKKGESYKNNYVVNLEEFWSIEENTTYLTQNPNTPWFGQNEVQELNSKLISYNQQLRRTVTIVIPPAPPSGPIPAASPQIYVGLDRKLGNFILSKQIESSSTIKNLSQLQDAVKIDQYKVQDIKAALELIYDGISQNTGIYSPVANEYVSGGKVIYYAGMMYRYENTTDLEPSTWFTGNIKASGLSIEEWNTARNSFYSGGYNLLPNDPAINRIFFNVSDNVERLYKVLKGDLRISDCSTPEARGSMITGENDFRKLVLTIKTNFTKESCFTTLTYPERKHIFDVFRQNSLEQKTNLFDFVAATEAPTSENPTVVDFDLKGTEDILVAVLATTPPGIQQTQIIAYCKEDTYSFIKEMMAPLRGLSDDDYHVGKGNLYKFLSTISDFIIRNTSNLNILPERTYIFRDGNLWAPNAEQKLASSLHVPFLGSDYTYQYKRFKLTDGPTQFVDLVVEEALLEESYTVNGSIVTYKKPIEISSNNITTLKPFDIIVLVPVNGVFGQAFTPNRGYYTTALALHWLRKEQPHAEYVKDFQNNLFLISLPLSAVGLAEANAFWRALNAVSIIYDFAMIAELNSDDLSVKIQRVLGPAYGAYQAMGFGFMGLGISRAIYHVSSPAKLARLTSDATDFLEDVDGDVAGIKERLAAEQSPHSVTVTNAVRAAIDGAVSLTGHAPISLFDFNLKTRLKLIFDGPEIFKDVPLRYLETEFNAFVAKNGKNITIEKAFSILSGPDGNNIITIHVTEFGNKFKELATKLDVALSKTTANKAALIETIFADDGTISIVGKQLLDKPNLVKSWEFLIVNFSTYSYHLSLDLVSIINKYGNIQSVAEVEGLLKKLSDNRLDRLIGALAKGDYDVRQYFADFTSATIDNLKGFNQNLDRLDIWKDFAKQKMLNGGMRRKYIRDLSTLPDGNLKISKWMINIRKELMRLNIPIEEFAEGNIAIAEITYYYPGTTKNTIHLIALSGDGLPSANTVTRLNGKIVIANLRDLYEQHNIVPDVPEPPSFFGFTRGQQDSERKIIEYFMHKLAADRGIKIDLSTVEKKAESVSNVLRGANVKITLVSEMKACNSCQSIIDNFNLANPNEIDILRGINYP